MPTKKQGIRIPDPAFRQFQARARSSGSDASKVIKACIVLFGLGDLDALLAPLLRDPARVDAMLADVDDGQSGQGSLCPIGHSPSAAMAATYCGQGSAGGEANSGSVNSASCGWGDALGRQGVPDATAPRVR